MPTSTTQAEMVTMKDKLLQLMPYLSEAEWWKFSYPSAYKVKVTYKFHYLPSSSAVYSVDFIDKSYKQLLQQPLTSSS